MRGHRLALLAALVAAAVPASVRAVVVTATDAHFVVKQAVAIAVPPPAVWHALTAEIGQWWSPDHTWSGNAANLSIDPRPGGCFCERLPDGGVRHMQVVHAKPPELLRLEGGLGPLQEQSLTGMMTWTLAPAGKGCALEVVYRVAGVVDGGLTTWAPLVDSVLGLQVVRLKGFVETGNPATGGEAK
jgi:uncharacterized protein YndB with AHSA1/START domain